MGSDHHRVPRRQASRVLGLPDTPAGQILHHVEGNKRLFRRTRIIFGQAYRPEATSRRPSPEEVQAIADEVLRRSYALGKEAR